MVGNMYYLRLKHMVANRLQSRARGPIQFQRPRVAGLGAGRGIVGNIVVEPALEENVARLLLGGGNLRLGISGAHDFHKRAVEFIVLPRVQLD